MSNYLDIAAELRQRRSKEQADRQAQMGQVPQGGGIISNSSRLGATQPQQPQSTTSVGSSILDGLRKYNDVSDGGLNRMLGAGSTGGAFTGATPATMSAMEAGGGSSLGAMALGNGAPAAGTGSAMAGAGPAGWLAMGAKALNDTGVSSYGNTMKGQWAGNITDKILGDRDKTGMAGNMTGAIGNFFGGDFGGSWDRGKSAVKDLFKLKFF